MQCPKCASAFETLKYGDVEVDRCSGCGGIWLDGPEREALEGAADPGAVDSGRARVGRDYDKLRAVDCPRCAVPMLSVADQEQFHVVYETCPECDGAFFDAGELRDLSHLTAFERLRKLLDVCLGVR